VRGPTCFPSFSSIFLFFHFSFIQQILFAKVISITHRYSKIMRITRRLQKKLCTELVVKGKLYTQVILQTIMHTSGYKEIILYALFVAAGTSSKSVGKPITLSARVVISNSRSQRQSRIIF
jgi:hypothetical protein